MITITILKNQKFTIVMNQIIISNKQFTNSIPQTMEELEKKTMQILYSDENENNNNSQTQQNFQQTIIPNNHNNIQFEVQPISSINYQQPIYYPQNNQFAPNNFRYQTPFPQQQQYPMTQNVYNNQFIPQQQIFPMQNNIIPTIHQNLLNYPINSNNLITNNSNNNHTDFSKNINNVPEKQLEEKKQQSMLKPWFFNTQSNSFAIAFGNSTVQKIATFEKNNYFKLKLETLWPLEGHKNFRGSLANSIMQSDILSHIPNRRYFIFPKFDGTRYFLSLHTMNFPNLCLFCVIEEWNFIRF